MRVKAIMDEPIIYYDDGMHLDGILSYAAYREYITNDNPPLPPNNGPWAIDFDLPLEKWFRSLPIGSKVDFRLLEGGKVWGWYASKVIVNLVHYNKMEYRKRPPMNYMRYYTNSKNHNVGAGPLKAFNVSFPTMISRELHWFAKGDIESVRRLLNLVSNIGKKSTTGMGSVESWHVDECDPCPIYRRLPIEDGTPRSIRPPYHHISRHVLSDWRMLHENFDE